MLLKVEEIDVFLKNNIKYKILLPFYTFKSF